MNFDEVARSALAALDCDASYVLAAQWAAERYQQLASRLRFRHLRVAGQVTVPAPIIAGTVTVVRGSNIVTGIATGWISTLADSYLRVQTNWYKIAEVRDATHIELTQPYSESPTGTGLTYKIVQRNVALAPDARWISNVMVHNRMRRPLDGPLAASELDLKFPERILVGGVPNFWGQSEDVISEGKKCLGVEIYPYPAQSEMFSYVYWKQPELFKPNEEVPRVVDGYQLKEGVLIDVMQYNASKAIKEAKVDVAAYWRNESRAQRTTWERVVLDVGKNDRGVDDLTFILQLTRSHMGWYGGIHTAQDEIMSRGRRP